MDSLSVSVIVSALLVAALLVARVVEVMTGHPPTQALTLAFQASVTALLSLLAFGHARRNDR